MKYEYNVALKRIQKIFDNQLIKSEDKFVPEEVNSDYNGIRIWVGVVSVNFIEIESVFQNLDDHTKTQIVKSLFGETLKILKEGPQMYSIMTNTDGLIAVYAAQYKSDLLNMYDVAVTLNTFSNMFSKILESKEIIDIPIGIGVTADKEIIVKYSEENTNFINDIYWLGDSVKYAVELSKKAGRRSIRSIALSKLVHSNIIDALVKRDTDYSNWIIPKYSDNKPIDDKFIEYYHCNVIRTNFDNWIKNNMKL